MRSARSVLMISLAFPLILLQLDLTSCLSGSGGNNSGGTPLFNAPPSVVLTTDVTNGIAPLTVHFSSAGSTDDGIIVDRLWDFADQQSSHDVSPTHTFQATGDYAVRLTLADDQGARASRTVTIAVTQAPVAVINVDRLVAEAAPAVFNFDASGSSDPDGRIVGYRWDFGDGSRELVPVVVHTFASAGTFHVRLTVTDNTGVTSFSDVIIQVGIPVPEISFRLPPGDLPSVALAPDSPLWVNVVFDVQAGIPRTIRAGLDGDRDICEAQAAVYDRQTGALLLRLTGHADRVRSVAVSPDSTRILTGSDDRSARLYDAVTGSLVRAADNPAGAQITSLAFSPDGTMYAEGATDGSVVLRSTQTGGVIRQFAGHLLSVNAVAFSASGRRVASASDDATVAVYDVQNGATVRTLTGHLFAVTSVAFSPTNSDQLVSAGVDQTARLWRVSDGALVRTFAGGHANAINAVAFSPDGRFILTGSDDSNAKLWETTGSAPIRVFAGHHDRVLAVAFSPDGQQAATGGVDGTAIIWNVASGAALRTLAPCVSAITSVAFSDNNQKIVLGVGARNDIQLDTNPAQGNDMNLSLPTALDLSGLTEDQYPAQYYLWAELDTDRTQPVRTYANPVIGIVRPFTPAIEESTPRIPLVNDEAGVVVAPSRGRQIFNLGPLRQGDRVFLSLLNLPGYGSSHQSDVFSVMLLDAQEKVFAWYQDHVVLLSVDSRLIVGHDSPSYFAIIDGRSAPPWASDAFCESIRVRIQRNVGLVPRSQRILLNFEHVQNIAVGAVGPFDIPAFDAANYNPAWGPAETAAIKARIVERLNELFTPYNVLVVSSDVGIPAQPYQTLLFGGMSDGSTGPLEDEFGAAAYIDPRNDTLTGTGLVFALDAFTALGSPTADQFGFALGNIAGHQAGHLLGLRHTTGGFLDLMDSSNAIDSAVVGFTIAPIKGSEEYNGQIGTQDVGQLFDEIIGIKP